MAVLFGGKSSDSFASLCYNSLSKKMINAKSFVTPERLPSIESSTKYHCQRVYLQIMVWMGEDGYMNTMDSGWKLVDTKLLPLMTNVTAAQENLLKMIHWNCTTDCRTQRCSCKSYGLSCTSACEQCQVVNCDNDYNQPIWEEELSDDN